MLDCSPLKFSIISHIDELVTRLHNLLLEMASAKLSDISEFMSNNAKKLVRWRKGERERE